jgi:hypothetical protein
VSIGLGAAPVSPAGIETVASGDGGVVGAALAVAVTIGAGREACVLPQAMATSAAPNPKAPGRRQIAGIPGKLQAKCHPPAPCPSPSVPRERKRERKRPEKT